MKQSDGIKKVLVANRGEIAMRVMRTCKEMGIATVAVYSEADVLAPFVAFADEAWCIGPAPSSESYLVQDKIIDVCKKTKADAVHPGYGFLSENADFARALKNAGIQLIGPSPEAMETMGSKLKSKEAVRRYDIPMVPGVDHAVADIAEAEAIAKEIGFPILVKASAGGGGKGMRRVDDAKTLPEALRSAMGEAQSAFNDPSVFIERYITSPKHIEIQVLADNHGNVIYLFERECSIQRRHQKVIEEAPSAVLTPELRKKMGACACDVARACRYSGAGTVEFLVDEALNFYFLEMNTRLQVEHPVTEMITGVDLVREQIRVAEGKPLSITQEELSINGHSIEVRVYAEDPTNNFLPDTGKLVRYRKPDGNGIRVDDGFEEGMDIPIYYDPMIAKLVVHDKDRKAAIAKMIRAIDEYEISGVKTTLGFCRFALQHTEFISGKFTTHFVQDHYQPELLPQLKDEAAMIGAALAAKLIETSRTAKPVMDHGNGNWVRRRNEE